MKPRACNQKQFFKETLRRVRQIIRDTTLYSPKKRMPFEEFYKTWLGKNPSPREEIKKLGFYIPRCSTCDTDLYFKDSKWIELYSPQSDNHGVVFMYLCPDCLNRCEELLKSISESNYSGIQRNFRMQREF